MSSAFIKNLAVRRSIYKLTSENFPISTDLLRKTVNDVVYNTPGAFNSQPVRAKILLGEQHRKLWSGLVPSVLKPLVSAEGWSATAAKLSMFEAGHGTVLFFEDQTETKKLQDQFPLYASRFPEWASHSSGAAQINTWAALAQESVGASLQHYNPLIDEQVAKEWNTPAHYRLTAQLVFGSIVEPAEEPTKTADLVTVES